ncbi:MAG: glutamate-semialdehyde -aminomutase-like protein [Pedosphaera sp.]|nr:glutamate-semialdehyde -aminomutase-like protein [Pedosphaera sp.]
MLIYGDPQFQATTEELLAGLRYHLTRTRLDDLDSLRALMIQAGQFEQAISDADPDQRMERSAVVITNLAAAAFYATYAKSQIKLPPSIHSANTALAHLSQALQSIPHLRDKSLSVKIPEGFEFYALYPEQHCHSALKWATDTQVSAPNRAVLVIGIRSIGTTLSALVMVTLEAAGWNPKRITVRPVGCSFDRTVDLPRSSLVEIKHALVVDEGPGLSGSSMAAVARSWVSAGLRHADVSFLPGHHRPPGQAASADIHRWWAATTRYVTPLEELRWDGLALTDSLAAKSQELCDATQPFPHIKDLSGGLWRESLYSDQTEYPPAAITFERLKFRCSADAGFSVFWKFTGSGALHSPGHTCASTALHRLTERAHNGWGPQPLGLFRSFVALPWIEGRPLSEADGRNPSVLSHIARYLADVSGPPLTASEQSAALARVTNLLYWNIKEVFGDGLANRALAASERIRNLRPCPTAGDGRLAPHEWMRTADGIILKLDGAGHDLDHTLIGCQPLYWDVAGTMIEWQLSKPLCSTFLAVLEARGVSLCPEALPFFCAAYAAFRMGQFSLCADAFTGDQAEHPRLVLACASYRDALAEQLQNLR